VFRWGWTAQHNQTEVNWYSSSWRQEQISHAAQRVSNDSVIRGCATWASTLMTHVSRTVSSCFAILRQIRSIRQLISQQVLQSLVVSLVLTHLDYSKSDASRRSKQPTGPTSVHDECSCSAHMFSMEIRPHHTAVPWPSLATSATADRVQTRCEDTALQPLVWSLTPVLNL